MKRMRRVLKLSVTDISTAVDRARSTVYRALAISHNTTRLPQRGRPSALDTKQVNHVVSVLRRMVRKAGARREITLAMIMKRARVKCSERTLRKSLVKKGIKFRRLREKPLLTKADRRERMTFATKFKDKPPSFWLKSIHMHIDCKTFPAYVTARAREYAAMREVRGAYRRPCEGLDEGYVVQPKSLRFNPGCKAVKIIAGVGNDQLMLWHDYGSRWNGTVAAKVYGGPLSAALRAANPRRRRYVVLEDNDPTGFKSNLGEAAKRRARIEAFCIPKRSPDLNVLDFAVWKPVNRKMREQERRMAKSTRESRAAYTKRLHKAARVVLKPDFVKKSIMAMRRRCRLVFQAKGGHFNEGGG